MNPIVKAAITHDGTFTGPSRWFAPFGDVAQDSILDKTETQTILVSLKIGQEIAMRTTFLMVRRGLQDKDRSLVPTCPNTGDVLKFIVPFSSTYKKRSVSNDLLVCLMFGALFLLKRRNAPLVRLYNPIIRFCGELWRLPIYPAIKNGSTRHHEL